MRNPELVMRQYRRYILSCKKKWGTARGLLHYSEIMKEYLDAKRQITDLSKIRMRVETKFNIMQTKTPRGDFGKERARTDT